MNGVPNIEACKACGMVEQVYRFTPTGRGPFCEDCWQMLQDPEIMLITHDRLDDAAITIKSLKTLLGRAADALELRGYTQHLVEMKERLIAELREAAK